MNNDEELLTCWHKRDSLKHDKILNSFGANQKRSSSSETFNQLTKECVFWEKSDE